VVVLSVMGRAVCVSHAQHRELTSREAWNALALPFFWVFTEHCLTHG
jgi:hypothetical protein